ncbi:MAG TPA: P1 family peptidase [Mycobacterium sp.]|nr:P1 family peptidase [Mycobacterium sp.]
MAKNPLSLRRHSSQPKYGIASDTLSAVRPRQGLAVLVVCGLLAGCSTPTGAPPTTSKTATTFADNGPRARARDLGIVIGRHPPGPLDQITDVSGVRVGQTTLISGEGKLVPGQGPVRTGVTAILPHGGDIWKEKVPAAGFVMNGNGEVTGLSWVNESGALEVPIVLTSTMNVPHAADGVLTWMMRRNPDIGVTDDVVLPVVGECDDSRLNDARGRHVTERDVLSALDGAREGKMAEGTVGAGTGMVAYGFKGGIGTASRVVGDYTVGALVNANQGVRPDLMINGAHVGVEIPDEVVPAVPGTAHSIIMVVATSAPLDSRQLSRVAKRAVLGLARTGSTGHHGSGDFALAFSTADRIPRAPTSPTRTTTVLSDNDINPIFEAAEEAVEEAIVNALLTATTVVGRDGQTAHAIPLDKLREVLHR